MFQTHFPIYTDDTDFCYILSVKIGKHRQHAQRSGRERGDCIHATSKIRLRELLAL
jgi:hypothetical protein